MMQPGWCVMLKIFPEVEITHINATERTEELEGC